MPNDWNNNIARNENLTKALHEIETVKTSFSVEVGTLLSPDGTIIKEWEGDDESVSIPPEDYKNKRLWENNIYTHNHIIGLHFSADDIERFCELPLLELRVSVPSNDFFSIIKKNSFYSKLADEMMRDKVGSFSKGIEFAIKQGVTFNNEDFGDKLCKLRIEHTHNWFKNNADKYNYIYEKGVL